MFLEHHYLSRGASPWPRSICSRQIKLLLPFPHCVSSEIHMEVWREVFGSCSEWRLPAPPCCSVKLRVPVYKHVCARACVRDRDTHTRTQNEWTISPEWFPLEWLKEFPAHQYQIARWLVGCGFFFSSNLRPWVKMRLVWSRGKKSSPFSACPKQCILRSGLCFSGTERLLCCRGGNNQVVPKMSTSLLAATDGNQVSCLIKAISDFFMHGTMWLFPPPPRLAGQSITCSPPKQYLLHHHLVWRLRLNPTVRFYSFPDMRA